MNKENYEGLRKQLDNGSLDIPSQITILEIAYNLEQQLKAYKDKEDKLREYIDKEINQPFTSVYDYEQGARDNLCQELYKILNEGDKQFKKEKGMWVSNE
jgi:hypothetical protein